MSDTDAPSSAAATSTSVGLTESGGAPLAPGSWMDRLREAFGFKTSATLRQNLEHALSQEDALDAAFSPEERAMIRNILRLRETQVDDVMVPRADIDSVNEDIVLADLLLKFETIGHSRMPVYRENLDDAVGMVHIKDLVAYVTTRARRPGTAEDGTAIEIVELGSVDLGLKLSETQLVRPVLFVPPSMPATDLLAKMQASHIQMALVIDEYGGTDGLVSIEDLVETIVGEIDDEHDEDNAPLVTVAAPGVFVADARAALDEVIAAVGPGFEVGDYDDDVDTLGGFLSALLERIPSRGEIVTTDELPGYEIEVLDADTRRIKKVRIVDLAARNGISSPRSIAASEAAQS